MEHTHYSFERGYHNPYSGKADPSSYEYQASLFDVQTIFQDMRQEDCIIDPPIRSWMSDKVLRLVKNGVTGKGGSTQFLMKDHHVLDIFKYFYQAYDHTVNVEPENYHWHYLLSKMDNWLLKTITDTRLLYSVLTTIAICKKFNNVLNKFNRDVENMSWQARDSYDIWQAIKDSFDGKTAFPYWMGDEDTYNKLGELTKDLKNLLEKSIQSGLRQAKKDIDKYREFMGNSAGDSSAELDYMEVYLDPEIISAVNVSGNSINKFVDKIIDTSTESLGGVPKHYQESIFEAEEIDDIEGIENLIHPALYRDLFVKTTKYHMNFDVYLDDSGSMTGYAYLGNGKRVRQRILVRFIALKLKKLGILRDVYIFDSTLKKIEFSKLLTARLGGGTDFTQLINNIKKTGRPGIIITDGHASMGSHSDKAFMINISGAHNYGPSVNSSDCPMAKMVKDNKYVYWNNGKFYHSILEPRSYSTLGETDVLYYNVLQGKSF